MVSLLRRVSLIGLAVRLIVASALPYPDGRHISPERLSAPVEQRLGLRLLSQAI
jgi:hypothetical protein